MSGRPTTMCFLSEFINEADGERPNESVSPFTESIIVATIYGRILEHKQRPSFAYQHHLHLQHPDRNRDTTYYEFCRRHRSLSALMTQHIKTLSMHLSSPSEHSDPALIFVALTAHTAVLMLSENLESQPLSTEPLAAQALLTEHKQRLLDAVHELGMLTATLTQVNHFQVSLLPYLSLSPYSFLSPFQGTPYLKMTFRS